MCPALEAWSPEKKHWCCTTRGKGCEGKVAPTVDPGYGMMWKHVQVGWVRDRGCAWACR